MATEQPRRVLELTFRLAELRPLELAEQYVLCGRDVEIQALERDGLPAGELGEAVLAGLAMMKSIFQPVARSITLKSDSSSSASRAAPASQS